MQDQLAYLTKGLAELIREEELRERLKQSAATGRPLRVKAGFDPTAPDLHLGHAVLLRKMKHFQDLGHTVIFLIGDMTGLIGDPTGRNITRPPMTREEIERNAETYKAQVFKILDPERTDVQFNSQWLRTMQFEDIIRLASKYTVARLLEREDFSKRYREGTPIFVHEFLYPLTQAYDSVALQCEVNLLVGREIQRDFGCTPQIVATVPLLEGLDGVDKMSKSKGNYVGITEPPEVMFNKLMSISDELMWRYYLLLTDRSESAIASMKAQAGAGSLHPMSAKIQLAREIVAEFHSTADAGRAAEEFNRVVRRKEAPSDIRTVSLPDSVRHQNGGVRLDKLLAAAGLAPSVTEANRKIKAGAVEINGVRVHDLVIPNGESELIIQVGRQWVRVTV
jgi:tyrosyl-tRNA synthetase